MYIFDSPCEVILLEIENVLSINSVNNDTCIRPVDRNCTRKVKFEFPSDNYEPIYLLPEKDGGGAVSGGKQLSLPFRDIELGIEITPIHNYIRVELGLYGLSLIYDCENYISIVVVDQSLVNDMARGLCGNIDGDPSNDLIQRYAQTSDTESVSFYANTWIVGGKFLNDITKWKNLYILTEKETILSIELFQTRQSKKFTRSGMLT